MERGGQEWILQGEGRATLFFVSASGTNLLLLFTTSYFPPSLLFILQSCSLLSRDDLHSDERSNNRGWNRARRLYDFRWSPRTLPSHLSSSPSSSACVPLNSGRRHHSLLLIGDYLVSLHEDSRLRVWGCKLAGAVKASPGGWCGLCKRGGRR